MRAVAVVAGLWLAALTVFAVAGPHGSSVGETSCTKLVQHDLHAAASAVGVSLAHVHVIACRQDGVESVARVEFDATIEAVGQTVHEVLAYRFVKSPWSIADVHQVG